MQHYPRGASSSSLRLWLVMTVLWAGATLLRVSCGRVLPLDRWDVWSSLWTWVDLLVPPVMFAGMLLVLPLISKAVRAVFNRRK